MLLRAGSLITALALQEAADAMSSNEIRGGLQNAIRAAHSGLAGHNDHWHSYVDHTGDEDSGDVIYTCDPDNDGDTDYVRAPYSKGTDSSDEDYTIDTDKGKQVQMRSSWEDLPDEQDHYASMESAKLYTKGPLPLCERFVSKKERDAAGSGSFAGKGKSFPILKAADVSAAASSIGRAGSGNYSTDVIKRNIIRIAKEKGWESELPKAWQDGGDEKKESKRPAAGGLQLTESATTLEPIVLREARADYEIKLIAPGKGSSAFYPAEVLKRDGPKVFGAGTHVYLNHPTSAEESARPEGDVKNLAGVLTTTAQYHESHPKGEGLYARMKVFADHAQLVEEKAAHVGMSIRASGVAESGRRQDGLPVLKELTGAESVDVVTRPGAGGMILTESARAAEGGEMTLEEAKRLIEAETAPIRQRALREDAREETGRLLEGLSLHPATKARITERILESALPTKDGALDVEKLRESVVKIAKNEGQYASQLRGGGGVFGMGAGEATPVDPKEAERRAAAEKSQDEDALRIFESLCGNKTAGQFAAKGRAA